MGTYSGYVYARVVAAALGILSLIEVLWFIIIVAAMSGTWSNASSNNNKVQAAFIIAAAMGSILNALFYAIGVYVVFVKHKYVLHYIYVLAAAVLVGIIAGAYSNEVMHKWIDWEIILYLLVFVPTVIYFRHRCPKCNIGNNALDNYLFGTLFSVIIAVTALIVFAFVVSMIISNVVLLFSVPQNYSENIGELIGAGVFLIIPIFMSYSAYTIFRAAKRTFLCVCVIGVLLAGWIVLRGIIPREAFIALFLFVPTIIYFQKRRAMFMSTKDGVGSVELKPKDTISHPHQGNGI